MVGGVIFILTIECVATLSERLGQKTKEDGTWHLVQEWDGKNTTARIWSRKGDHRREEKTSWRWHFLWFGAFVPKKISLTIDLFWWPFLVSFNHSFLASSSPHLVVSSPPSTIENCIGKWLGYFVMLVLVGLSLFPRWCAKATKTALNWGNVAFLLGGVPNR